jgi:hypothetical protein
MIHKYYPVDQLYCLFREGFILWLSSISEKYAKFWVALVNLASLVEIIHSQLDLQWKQVLLFL